MNKAILSLVGYSGSIAAVLGTATIANPDTAKIIPYPEVMNLSRVPRFNDLGMIAPTDIGKESLPKQYPKKQSIAKAKPIPLTVDTVSQAVRAATITKSKTQCFGCRDLSPSLMVIGYSSAGTTTSYPRLTVY
jgi:hypothetical protein